MIRSPRDCESVVCDLDRDYHYPECVAYGDGWDDHISYTKPALELAINLILEHTNTVRWACEFDEDREATVTGLMNAVHTLRKLL